LHRGLVTCTTSHVNVIVNGSNTHLEDEGSGPPALFLHGNPDSSILWRQVIKELKPRFRCLAPDLPGFGRSAFPQNFHGSLEEMAAFVDELLIVARVTEPINLVVHDFGGPYGLAWSVKNPSKIRRLAILNTIFTADYKWHFWGRIWRTPVLGELSMITMNRWTFRASMRRSSPGLSDEHLRETYALITPATKKMILRLYRAADPGRFKGWEEGLLQLTQHVPTCVLWGDRDPYVGSTFAERFGAQEIFHYPDYGHWLPVEAPREVSARLMEFFA
jgi:pimeloyl-ACP methyl ester carboxylesterase